TCVVQVTIPSAELVDGHHALSLPCDIVNAKASTAPTARSGAVSWGRRGTSRPTSDPGRAVGAVRAAVVVVPRGALLSAPGDNHHVLVSHMGWSGLSGSEPPTRGQPAQRLVNSP